MDGATNILLVRYVPVTAGCCDSKMTNPGFPTCPKATTGSLVVARYRQVELLGNDVRSGSSITLVAIH